MRLELYPFLYRNVISKVDAERAHNLAISSLAQMSRFDSLSMYLKQKIPIDDRMEQRIGHLNFPNPLGVAAGLDKDAHAYPALGTMGFGHVEVGTITPEPQPGNPKPRIWRIQHADAVVNAMGFPSDGMHEVKKRLAGRARDLCLGINIGKNKERALERAVDDYLLLVDTLFDEADYFTINVSSPNTPRLRELQTASYLKDLVSTVVGRIKEKARKAGKIAPLVFVKLAPDFDNDTLLTQAAKAAIDAGAHGIVATNTTSDRSALLGEEKNLPGGLSGKPLYKRSQKVIATLYDYFGGDVPIIGVGGVFNAEDLIGHIRAGASLVQVYTGFIYQGPFWPRRLLAELITSLIERDVESICDFVGCDAKSILSKELK